MEELGSPVVTVSGADGTTALSGPEAVKLGHALTDAIRWAYTARGQVVPGELLDFAITLNRASRASASRSLPRSAAVLAAGKSPEYAPGASSAQTVKVAEAARLAGVSPRWLREHVQRGNVLAVRGHRGALLVRTDSLAAWIGARSREETERRRAA